jgi:hypothetical protein
MSDRGRGGEAAAKALSISAVKRSSASSPLVTSMRAARAFSQKEYMSGLAMRWTREGDPREEDTDRRDGLPYLGPAVERSLIGMEQEQGGYEEARGDHGDAGKEGGGGERDTQGLSAHRAYCSIGIADLRSSRAVRSRASMVSVLWVIHPPDCDPLSP